MTMTMKRPTNNWTCRNRAPLPPGEAERLSALSEQVLACLVLGPQTNATLSKVALDYGRSIRELRHHGHWIEQKRIEGGLHSYTLMHGTEPEWIVPVRVTLHDGTVSYQSVIVRGTNVGTVRNRAQHLATSVMVGDPRQISEGTPQ
jgi:hypothetical protein